MSPGYKRQACRSSISYQFTNRRSFGAASLCSRSTEMTKMCLAHLGVFLLALHLVSSQGPNATDAPMNMTTMMSNYTMTPTVMVNVTSKNGSGMMEAFTLLLPLALAASVLLGCSH